MLTVGELRGALDLLRPDMPVWVEYDNRCAGDDAVEVYVEDDERYGRRLVVSTGD